MAADEPHASGRWDAFLPPGRGGVWPWGGSVSLLLGTLLLAAIAALTVFWGVPHFEQRLDRNVRSQLQAKGIDAEALNFDWEYRNVSVSGQLPSGVSEDELRTALRDTDGGGIRDIDLSLESAVEKPQDSGVVDVTATLADGKMLLQGSVLNANQRDRLQAAAVQAIGETNVTNEITVSGLQEKTPGSNQRVDSLANSIAGLNQAVSADARLSATDFRFNATVADETQVDDLLRLRGNAGDVGLVISGDIVAKKSAPSAVDVVATKENGRITLSGVVTSEAQKQQLVSAALRVFDQSSVTDEIVVADPNGAAEVASRKVDVLASAISYFAEAIEADAHLTTDEFEFNALLEYEEDTTPLYAVTETATNLGLSLTGTIQARQMSLSKEVTMLQSEIDSLADEIRDNVIFESGKAELSFAAKQTLDKVVDAMNRYQRPVVQIAGHTDSSGAADANQTLSLFRATAVLEYLKQNGIAISRLRSRGFGESMPIASNTTEVGKKQNRRVEFTALGNFGN